MKQLLFLLIISMLAGTFNCTMAQDTLLWNNHRPLTWTDFQGEPNFSVLYRMLSSTGIKYTYRKSRYDIQYEVTAFFLPLRSWKKYIEDSTLLHHEQIHFNITELYARRLLKILKKLDMYDPQLHQKIVSTAEALIEEKNNMQRRYDKETHFGELKRAQQKWDEMIRKWMTEIKLSG